jgi:hypothetical protein
MNYTIRIAENDLESKKLFIKIKELEERYMLVLKTPYEDTNWDDIKADLLNQATR